jgi:hypothetical protein
MGSKGASRRRRGTNGRTTPKKIKWLPRYPVKVPTRAQMLEQIDLDERRGTRAP